MSRSQRILTALGATAASAFSAGPAASRTPAGAVQAPEVCRAIEAGNAIGKSGGMGSEWRNGVSLLLWSYSQPEGSHS